MASSVAVQWVATDFGGPEVLEQRSVALPAPGADEVTIEIHASGINPADWRHIAPGQNRSLLPLTLGFEASGIIAALGSATELAAGGGAVGDEVVAYQIIGGYSTALNVRSSDVFAKPAKLSFAAAANLLLVGSTASEMLNASRAKAGDTVLLHGASGAVGTSVLQQARLLGVTVIGTAGDKNFDVVRRYGGIPVAYGSGLEERVRKAAPDGVVAALDAVGTDEAVDVSLALVRDRTRIITIAAFKRGPAEGLTLLGQTNPTSGPYRAAQRPRLLGLAAKGELEVPMAATFAFDDARAAFAALLGKHPPGKLALVA